MKEVFILIEVLDDYEQIIDVFSNRASALDRLLDYGTNIEDDSEGDYDFRPVYDEEYDGYWVRGTHFYIDDILLKIERHTVKD